MRPFRKQVVPDEGHRFVRFIWNEMNRQQVSQEDVADRSGWSASAMRKWRKGNRAIPLQAMQDVLNVLGFDLIIRPDNDSKLHCCSKRSRKVI